MVRYNNCGTTTADTSGLGKKSIRDDQAYIFNIIQKRPNAGCRDKNSGTPKQNKERHESRYPLYFHEELEATVTWPS